MNKELWNMYKESPRGRGCIELFNPEKEDMVLAGFDILQYADKWGDDKTTDDDFGSFENNMFIWTCNLYHRDIMPEEWTKESFSQMMENLDMLMPQTDDDGNPIYDENKKVLFTNDIAVKKEDYRGKVSMLPWLSLLFYYSNDWYMPILLRRRFDIVQKNCDALGIVLPDMPRPQDHKAFFAFYFDVCQIWKEFQNENGLTDAELCACIYDFATMLYEPKEKSELPKPTNVWLTGADKGDFTFLDSLGKDGDGNEEHIWACNERTRRGDIIIIYCTTPRSHIHSIWRSEGGGFFNPFDYYHCRSKVCNGILTPPITFNDLRSDAYMSKVPIVKRRLQGINGIELTARDYSELMRMIGERGGDTSQYPQLFDGSDVDFGEIAVEKDVEEKILIPMLRKLGYTETDWTRQLTLKAGRKEKAIPDFVFFPHGEKHFESAPLVIEAKLDMAPVQEQMKAFKQGLSYARMLRSGIMGICDKERLVLYKVDKNGGADRNAPIFEDHWAAIYTDAESGAALNKLIGREVIVNI